MRIRMLSRLDEVAAELRRRRGEPCGYCTTMHPVGQCENPRNWSNSEPARHSAFAILKANEQGQQDSGIVFTERLVLTADVLQQMIARRQP